MWAQDKIDEVIVVVKKIGGDRNVADILTKYFWSPRLRSLLAELPVAELEGRHSLAPQLHKKIANVFVHGGLFQKGRGREGVQESEADIQEFGVGSRPCT